MLRLIASLTLCIAFLIPAISVGQVSVVTTLPDYASLVKMVGGDKVSVRVLAQPTEDPHYVDPKPSFVVSLHSAQLLVSNGFELEIGWLPNLVLQSRNPGIQLGQPGRLVVGDHVERPLEVPTGAIDRSMGDVHAQGNPHFNHDPRRMRGVLPVIADRLSQIDPKNQAVYEKNLATALTNFDEFLSGLQAKFSGVPAQNRYVVTYHKSLSYLLETLGFKAAINIEPKPGVPPNPAHVAQVLSTMKRKGIGVIIQEDYYPNRTAQTLAKLGQGELVVIAGGTKRGSDYLSHVRTTTDRILSAVTRKE